MPLELPEPGNAFPGSTWLIHCDGSAFPNPGRMGLGASLTAPDGTRYEMSVTARGMGCNNEAEARAVMAGLEHARQLGAKALTVYSDSRVVVDQLSDEPAKPVARLAPLFDELRALLASFAQARIVWLPGHRNGEADALARVAAGLPPRTLKKRF